MGAALPPERVSRARTLARFGQPLPDEQADGRWRQECAAHRTRMAHHYLGRRSETVPDGCFSANGS